MKSSAINFDVDSWWALLDMANKKAPKKKDFVIKESIPRILKLLNKYKIKATFFVLGPDVENFTRLYKAILKNKHEIANHTYSHFHNLRDLHPEIIKEEIKKSHDIIKDRLHITPIGFRAPYYSINEKVLNIIEKIGYTYDSSVCSAFFPQAFPLKWLKAPSKPYNPSLKDITKKGNAKIVEIPLASNILKMPVLGTTIGILGNWWLKVHIQTQNFLNINFHARDAVRHLPKVSGIPKFVYFNHDLMLQRLDNSLYYLSKKTKPLLLKDIALSLKRK